MSTVKSHHCPSFSWNMSHVFKYLVEKNMSSAGDMILLGTCLILQVLGREEHQFSR